MTRTGATLWVSLLLLGIAGGPLSAQKGKKITGGPSDAVFRDNGSATDPGADRIRSDGFLTQACASGADGEQSRYCGGNYMNPDTGLTYGGVGQECSRISYGSNGSYAFRTMSSKCDPPADLEVGQRRVRVDFTKALEGVCRNGVTGDEKVPITIAGIPRELDACGENTIDDVQIIADTMFSGATTPVRLHLSLFSPDLANTTQFLLEFTAALPVVDNGSSRTVSADGQSAILYRTTVGRGGKLTKDYIGEYVMPFAVTAREAPMPEFGGQ